MVIGLAGRRVDAADAEPRRFPPEPKNIERVRRRLHGTLVSEGAVGLVSSAACGADLLALEQAGRLGLRRKIVLPCDPKTFRTSSVTDRPGDWGPLFDAAIREADAQGDLIILGSEPTAFVAVNHAIIEEALALGSSRGCLVAAVRVWEGRSRGPDDLTEEFGKYARSRGVSLLADIGTL